MGKQINVGLKFTADTGQAKASIQELQSLLNKLSLEGASTSKTAPITEAKRIREAAEAAKELSYHLNNAYNVKTGRFDLSALDKSLKISKSNITELSTKLIGAGDTGQQAFLKLAQSISQADQPMLKVSNKLQDFAKVLKQTAKYQLSNNMIRGFTGAVQSAYGYAKDLNASLTDIRIVTGQNVDQMAKFAEQANKAAKALSTTTTDYTKGSLIYFQQGLGDEEVRERTEATIKMSNVTGESTSKIADQLTAVWNNFADGSKQLSYYADVMTALGAATASSSDEISEGINKFAATAKTVGLSYEYATAALATVTARTRESADVVGNAFKTLFARIQGLNQGDTLDDGTTLNKYSSALDKVGINIKTTSGELKGMDVILDELGPKWKTLADDQKMALAQTVAGVRQYSQFMALMNNYDYFKENVGVAEQSAGTLDKQAEIYAESWEAAQKRVRAAAEGVYQDLIDDKFFISLNNGLADVISGLDAFIEKAGGLKTIIMALSGVILANFSNKIPKAIDKVRYNFDVLTKGSDKAYQNIINEMRSTTEQQFSNYDKYKQAKLRKEDTSKMSQGINRNSAIGEQIKNANELSIARNKYAMIEDQLTETEQQRYKIELSVLQTYQEQQNALVQQNENLEKNIESRKKLLLNADIAEATLGSSNEKSSLNQLDYLKRNNSKGKYDELIKDVESSVINLDVFREDIVERYQKMNKFMVLANSQFYKDNININDKYFTLFDNKSKDNLTNSFTNFYDTLANSKGTEQASKAIEVVKANIESLQTAIPKSIQQVTGLDKAFRNVTTSLASSNIDEFNNQVFNLEKTLKNARINGEDFGKVLQEIHGKSFNELVQMQLDLGDSLNDAIDNAKQLKEIEESFNPSHTIKMSEAFGSLAGGIMSGYSAIQGLKSIITSLNDEDLSAWEKFGAIISGLVIVGPSLASFGKMATTVGTFAKNFKLMKAAAAGTGQAIGGAGATAETAAGGFAALGVALKGTLIIAAVGAALWALIKLFEYFKERSPEGQLEKITKATEDAKQRAEEAADAYENLKTAFDNYDTAIDKLGEMEQGTQAFRDALEDANKQAWDLIEKYNLIKGTDWHIDNTTGAVVIDQKGKEKAQNSAYEEKASSEQLQKTLTMAQSQAKLTVAESKLDSLQRMAHTTQSYDDLISKLTQDGKSLSQIKKDWSKYQTASNEDKDKIEFLQTYSNILFGKVGAIEETRSVLDYLPQLEDYKEAKAQYNRDQELYTPQVVQSILNGNKDYQDSQYKSYINDKVSEDYAEIQKDISNQWDSKNGTEINDKFEEILDKAGYEKHEDGKFYNKDTQEESTYYSTLTQDQKKNIIVADETQQAAASGVSETVNNFNEAIKNLDQDKLDSLSKGISGFSKEELNKIQEVGASDYFSDLIQAGQDSQNESVKKFVNSLVDQFQKDLNSYDPTSFDIASWQENFNKQLEIVGKISDGGIVDDEYFNGLSSDLQKYFEDMHNGTHQLTISAEEFLNIIRENNIKELKDSIETSKSTINKDLENFGGGFTQSDVDSIAKGMLANSSSEMYSTEDGLYGRLRDAMGLAEGKGILAGLTEQKDKVEAVAQAWLNLTEGLYNQQIALGVNQSSIKELNDALAKGDITLEQYNKTFNSVLATEAKANGIDYSKIEEYTKAIIKNNRYLEDNIQLAQEMVYAYLKTEKGVKKISDSQDDWNKAIKNSSKDVVQYLKVVNEIKDAYKQVFNTIDSENIDNLSNEFLTSAETMDLMNKAMTGSEQDWNNWEAYVLAEINNTSAAFNGMTEEMKSSMTELTTMAANLDFSGLIPGADIQDQAFIDKLESLQFATATAAQAMSDNLSSIGVDATVEPVEADVPEQVTHTTQKGTLIATDSNGKIISVDVSGDVTETQAPKKYTYYKLTGAKYNGRGVRPASATPAKRGGGGGGGSKKSTSHADQKNYSDKERYHTIKNQIEDLNSAYDDLNKAKDRAFGKDRLKYMDSEISKTQELIDAQEEYLRQIKANLPTDKSIMEKAYNEYIGGPAIEYDASGNISNFDEIQDAMFEEYNRMAQKYTDDSDEWKIFEKKYELLEKYIKQYEETYDLARDEQSKLQELQNQKVDLQLEQVQYEVEIKLDIPDSQIKVLEYKLGRIDDDAFKALDAIELMSQKADNLKQQIAINKQGLNDVLSLTMSAEEISQILAGNLEVLNKKTLTDNQVSAIKEYRDNLLDLNSQFDDLRKEIEDKVMSAFDAWKEKLDKGIASIDHYNTVLDNYKNIIDIVGKDTLGITDAFMTNLAQRTTDNAINKLRSVKSEYETIIKARDEASSKLADAEARKDKASIDFWQQTLDAINEEVESSNEEMMQAWQDALESLTTQFENTMNNLIDTFNKSVYALGGLDALGDDFSRQQENADLMLDDYQKIYELSKLSRDVNKTIDDTDIISGKQKLKKLLGQINDLQEDGNKMSKYDLEYLQKTYDLRLAEIELEEAQRAKNTVRLQKDNEGNWSYIYTQSSDAIDSAQQKYEDALYAMQDLSSNYIDEMSEKLISTSKEMQEAIAAIRIQDYANIDDYYAAVKRVQDQYEEEMNTQQNELQKAIDNNKELYNTDWQNYHDATGYKISDLENFATTFKDTLLGTLLNSESDTANFTNILKDSVDGLTNGLLEASRQYYLNLEEAMNAAGTSTKQFADDASQAINQVISDSDKGTEAVKKMSEEMKTAFEDITNSVSSWQESYGMSMEKIIQSNLNVIESFNNMLEALSIDPSDLEITYNVAKKMDSDAKKPDSFDTGGYTGNWGSSGRLAMLHQKELVLNESDTANMLTAVQITRAMLDTIDLNARQASFGLGNLVASGIRDDKTETLQQEVKITAEFPNVQDHTEIEQAFNNLINQASQYANRK